MSLPNPASSPPEAVDAPPRRRLPALLEALRPKQWTKNGLLFAALLFSIDQRHPLETYLRAGSAFVVFCLLSGLTYLVNDIVDVAADRLHPKKRHRPIASGRLSVGAAWTIALLGIPALLVVSWTLGVKFLLAALAYLVVTLAYSFFLKHQVIVDVLTLASLFVVRAAAGAFAIAVPISEWLLLCTLLLALFLGLAKRRGELVALGDRPATRRSLAEYTVPMLDQMITIVGASCIMSYTLYSFYSHTGQRRPYLMATIPFVLYGLFRYLYLSHRKGVGEAPETVLLEDKPLLINIVLFAITAGLVLSLR